MDRILSGVRPTGDIHLGNYLGAIKNWVALQHNAKENLFCIVDLHALTTLEETTHLAESTLTVAAAYLAAGIDTEKSFIFAQSHVRAITELSWIFSCLTPLGWLNRMTQFKEKAGKNKDLSCLGLYSYPVLMAADILLYKASHVPVGDDQKQHLELSRDIAGAFNRRYSTDLFPIPEPLILGIATRVMSLRDGTSKMSKSDPSDYSRILMMDSADTMALKIRKAKTDMDPIPPALDALTSRPEALNLVTIMAALLEETPQEICERHEGQGFAEFKRHLSEVMIEKILPLGDRMRDYLKDRAELTQLLKKGAERANSLAEAHMKEIRTLVGLL